MTSSKQCLILKKKILNGIPFFMFSKYLGIWHNHFTTRCCCGGKFLVIQCIHFYIRVRIWLALIRLNSLYSLNLQSLGSSRCCVGENTPLKQKKINWQWSFFYQFKIFETNIAKKCLQCEKALELNYWSRFSISNKT